jgi:hypothetical protein
VASFTQEVNICRKLATELGFIQPGPTPIAKGNTGAIALLEHGHLHVHLRWCFVCEYLVLFASCCDQLAIIGTEVALKHSEVVSWACTERAALR